MLLSPLMLLMLFAFSPQHADAAFSFRHDDFRRFSLRQSASMPLMPLPDAFAIALMLCYYILYALLFVYAIDCYADFLLIADIDADTHYAYYDGAAATTLERAARPDTLPRLPSSSFRHAQSIATPLEICRRHYA